MRPSSRVWGAFWPQSLAYLVMHNREVQHLFFVFPGTVAGASGRLLLLGRYSGYRLVELLRFKVLIKEAR